MNTKHEHYDAIVGWASGETIQYFNGDDNVWCDLVMTPIWAVGTKYRVKPKLEYPITLMKYNDLKAAYSDFKSGQDIESSWHSDAARNLANAAIRHAIDSGQVIIAHKGE